MLDKASGTLTRIKSWEYITSKLRLGLRRWTGAAAPSDAH